MRRYIALLTAAAVSGSFLAACHEDHGGPPSQPPPPSATAFEPFVANQVEDATCDNTAPVQTNSIDFSFAPDQDTAQPRDVSAATTACKAS